MAKCLELGLVSQLPCVTNQRVIDSILRESEGFGKRLLNARRSLSRRDEQRGFAHPLSALEHSPHNPDVYRS